MAKKKSDMRMVGDAGTANSGEAGAGAALSVESIRIHKAVPGVSGGQGVSLFDICDLLQNDLGIPVAMQEVITQLGRAGVESVKVQTMYGGIVSAFGFDGWYKTWDCAWEPFMSPAGIEALEQVPEYAALKQHPAWEDLKRRVAREQWRVVE